MTKEVQIKKQINKKKKDYMLDEFGFDASIINAIKKFTEGEEEIEEGLK